MSFYNTLQDFQMDLDEDEKTESRTNQTKPEFKYKQWQEIMMSGNQMEAMENEKYNKRKQ